MNIWSAASSLAAVVVGTIALGCAAPVGEPTESVGSTEEAVTTQNGTTMNGTTMNGTTMNGTTMNGTTMNGTTMNGTTMNGTTMNGVTLNGTTMNGTTMNGTTMNGTDFVGAVFPVYVNGTQVFMIRIVDMVLHSQLSAPPPPPPPTTSTKTPITKGGLVDEDALAFAAPVTLAANAAGDYYWYILEWAEVSNPKVWHAYCGDPGSAVPAYPAYPNLAVPVRGAWGITDLTGRELNTETTHVTFACRGGAIAKSIEVLNYHWWETKTYGSIEWGENVLRSSVRAIMGAWCAPGDTTPYTKNGTLIDVHDNFDVNSPTPNMTAEAVWGPDGPLCANAARVQEWVLAGNGPPCLQRYLPPVSNPNAYDFVCADPQLVPMQLRSLTGGGDGWLDTQFVTPLIP